MKTDPSDRAEEYFNQKYNCAQSVLMTYASQGGINEETAARLAACFGAGLARRGEVCGAVTGGLMVLGICLAKPEPEDKEGNYQLAQEFMHYFENRHGTLMCRKLIGFDLTTPEGRQQAEDSGVTRTICPALVRDSAAILEYMLTQQDGTSLEGNPARHE
jgi:C_GCAxxG_C_C family probable redox protein